MGRGSQPSAHRMEENHAEHRAGGNSGWGLLPQGSCEYGRDRAALPPRVQWRDGGTPEVGWALGTCILSKVSTARHLSGLSPLTVPKPWIPPEPSQRQGCQSHGSEWPSSSAQIIASGKLRICPRHEDPFQG